MELPVENGIISEEQAPLSSAIITFLRYGRNVPNKISPLLNLILLLLLCLS